MRRFLPAPDSTIDQGDRQQVAGVYAGVLAGEAAEAATVNICFTADICTAVNLTADIGTALSIDAPIYCGLNLTADVGGLC